MAALQDASNSKAKSEAQNKRLQGKFIFRAQSEYMDVVGVYPIINGNDYIYTFTVWEYNDYKHNKSKKNPGLKVKLKDIHDVVFDYKTELDNGDRLKYKSTTYNMDDFLGNYCSGVI